jgi:nitroimidazol reductase NimA-like FMN-containing flavoprotein (pyridoxamine 5'-phosphate oxidase superfamily)
MDIVKMPRMKKAEYDQLIENEHICRIAFKGEEHPYIAPFLYVFDGQFMYFLSTKYGKKIQYFRQNPDVCVEVESYSPDLSSFRFVVLPGRLVEVEWPEEKHPIRQMFVDLIQSKNMSQNILSALGHSPGEPVESILTEDKTSVWKLVGVKKITGLKGSDGTERSN